MLTYFQAIVLGLLQGLTELFPISSLGHSVLVAWLFNWTHITEGESHGDHFFVSFLVILHVATAVALIIFYRQTWWRLVRGWFGSVRRRRVDTPDAKLAWLLILATIPVGVIAMAFQDSLQERFANPLPAIGFLFLNGLILLAGDRFLKRSELAAGSQRATVQHVTGTLTFRRAMLVGVSQLGALFPGISRSGATMVSGLFGGLNHEDAARFSFLLATPVILGAGIVKLPDLIRHLEDGLGGQILVGGVVAGLAAYFAVSFLDRYFRDKTLRPFGLYCIIASLALLVIGFLRGGF